MNAQVVGISGSPIRNSNTDRLVQAVLDASDLNTEFVKLSKITVRGCVACLRCAGDNVCKQMDDFSELGPKVRLAEAVVIGAYTPYGSMDSFTKAFLERLFSLRHRVGLNRGKLAVVITTGIGRGRQGLHEANEQIVRALHREGMEVLGRLEAIGNPPCLSCGYGESCPMSSIPFVFGGDSIITPDKFTCVEDQSDLWKQAQEFGNQLGAAIRGRLVESA
ncbi:MAG: flavodoxin family protein [Desulfomonilaceae bacterium]